LGYKTIVLWSTSGCRAKSVLGAANRHAQKELACEVGGSGKRTSPYAEGAITMTTDVAIPADVVIDEHTTLPRAIAILTHHLDRAVGAMAPDVLALELSCDQGTAKFKFYAYKLRPASGGAA
jgi:hypothetical protein